MIEKRYLSANDLLADSFRLANKILDRFPPDPYRGHLARGAPVGIAVQELLEYRRDDRPYRGPHGQLYRHRRAKDEVQVYSLGYLIDTLEPTDKLLVIDDVFDSGRSIAAFMKELAARCRHNTPKTIRSATVYYKPRRSKVDIKPDFYVYETDEWLVFPHEVDGLTVEEIRKHKPEAAIILREE
jgi:hypoxanthine phosphoribosyltransferase